MGRGDSTAATLDLDDVLRVSVEIDDLQAEAFAEEAEARAEAFAEIDELLEDIDGGRHGTRELKELIGEQHAALQEDGDPEMRKRVERAISIYLNSLFTYEPRNETPQGRIDDTIGRLRAVPTLSALSVSLNSWDDGHLRKTIDATTTLCGKKLGAEASTFAPLNDWGEPCEQCLAKLSRAKDCDQLKELVAMSAGASDSDWQRVQNTCADLLKAEMSKRKTLTDNFWFDTERKLWDTLHSESVEIAVDRVCSLPAEERFNMLFSPYSSLSWQRGKGNGADEEIVSLLDSFEIVLGRDRSSYPWPTEREEWKQLLLDAQEESSKLGSSGDAREVSMVGVLTVRLFPEVAQRHLTNWRQFGKGHGQLHAALKEDVKSGGKRKRSAKRGSR